MDWDLVHGIIDAVSGEGGLQTAIEEHRAAKKLGFFITLILAAVCLGIMYLRFRVLG